MRATFPRKPGRASRGFVLVNALVLVAALASVVVFLLQRSEGMRLRLAVGQEAAQLQQYLNAFDALALHMLAQEGDQGVDHLAEAWAIDLPPVVVGRGQVAGEIYDLQGRFNLNWLANPADAEAATAFEALFLRLGMPTPQADAIRAFLQPGGPEQAGSYAQNTPGTDPVGGALLMPAQLRQIPGLSAAHYDRLAAHVAVLPGEMKVNINTVTPVVLAALLPADRPALADLIVQQRTRAPFVSGDDLSMRLQQNLGDQALEGVSLDRFGVTSTWFGLNSTARLAQTGASRQAVIQRRGAVVVPRIVWRLDKTE